MTVIQFIGLLIVTSLNTGGWHIILPHLVTVTPRHDAYIAYRIGERADPRGWPAKGRFVYAGERFEYVAVQNEVVEFQGSADAPSGAADNLPHLTCCCVPMQDGLLEEFRSTSLPASRRRAAHFMVRNGAARVIADVHGAAVSQVTMTSASGLTLSAGPGHFLKLKPGAKILVGHSLIPPGSSSPGVSDFHGYYETGRNPVAKRCTATPMSDPSRCGPKPQACDDRLVTAASRRLQPRILDVNIDCSNTHWP